MVSIDKLGRATLITTTYHVAKRRGVKHAKLTRMEYEFIKEIVDDKSFNTDKRHANLLKKMKQLLNDNRLAYNPKSKDIPLPSAKEVASA
jgi:hypothetical protein